MSASLTVVDHPLVRHKVALLRDRAAAPATFRRTMRELGALLLYEATRPLPLAETDIETPLERGRFPTLAEVPCFVSILRAGNGLIDGMLDMLPDASVGHIGLYRDHETLEAIEYYFRIPDDIARRPVLVADPMLATGHSAAAALSRLKQAGARRISFVCVLAAPEGARRLAETHPDVPVIAAALDRGLNDKGYILPGLGDAGDRTYGTL
ncbi:uracil phosphoribosyltransferase [Amphiplicatus metriothermophilus]|uniref:Uracil phosphoribosyltransferase n=1 Tax=Amphiplicatus metriothermophilus TaxID=1519374 RepID=A0A239PZ11_9PROT|nr:uracil phosphoribosyltransferase [Amphiplicatus metriothermophilus]MBB5518215.1 uracil phosphoribosyltransferase [Amphiplicatus metriothermophilus]SNT75400.1 uracil phosphoribosyltransferase [Amphiplicatus metriothermophilus]